MEPEKRLFSRLNDKVDLDSYISTLESGLDDWIKTHRYSPEEEKLFRNSYREMIDRLNTNDGTFQYNGGNGFKDTTRTLQNGIDDKKKKTWDAAGRVSAYLGTTLRGMAAYTPEENKTTYEDGVIGKMLLNELFGSSGTIQDFLDLDKIDETTNTRSNTNRTTKFRKSIESLINKIRTDESLGWTDEQKNKKISDLNSLFTIFDNDGTITNDEYLDLAKITELNNLRDMFSTDGLPAEQNNSNQPDSNTNPEVSEENKSKDSMDDFINWINENYAPYTGPMQKPYTMGNQSNINFQGPYTGTTFLNALKKKSTRELQEGLLRAINNPKTWNTGNDPLVRSIFTNKNFDPKIKATTYICTILKELKKRDGALIANPGEDQVFYIKGSKSKDRNTAFVWNEKNNTLYEKSIHDIPVLREKLLKKWKDSLNGGNSENTSLYDIYRPIFSAKNGGVLKYAEGSKVMNRNLTYGGITKDTNPYLNVENTEENAKNIDLWDDYYSNFLIDNDISHSYNSLGNTELPERVFRQLPSWDNLLTGDTVGFETLRQDERPDELVDSTPKFWNYGYQLDANGNRIKGADGKDTYGISGALVATYLNELNDIGSKLSWDKKVDDTGYLDWNKKFDQTGLNMYFGSDTDRFDLMGPSTWNRHGFLENLKKQYNNKDSVLKIGDNSIYYDGTKWVLNDVPKSQRRLEENSKTKFYYTTKPLNNPNEKINTELSGGSDITETGDTENKGNDDDSNFKFPTSQLMPYLSDALRLNKSLSYNQKIRNTVKKAMNPVTYNPYEIYTPVTGAFDQLQLSKNLGAKYNFLANKAFTSDANLMAARSLEGQMKANDIENQGFLADNNEIKRTQERALQNRAKNIELRNTVANKNMQSINQTNLQRAYLDASKLQKDWNSIDNYLKGTNERITDFFDKRNAAQQDIQLYIAQEKYKSAIQPYQEKLQSWMTANPGKLITSYPNYANYKDALEKAQKTLSNEIQNIKGSPYGLNIKNYK